MNQYVYMIRHDHKSYQFVIIIEKNIEPVINLIIKTSDVKQMNAMQTGKSAEISLIGFSLSKLYWHIGLLKIWKTSVMT